MLRVFIDLQIDFAGCCRGVFRLKQLEQSDLLVYE